MPLPLATAPFTLLIEDQGAQLWDPQGALLVRLPDPGTEHPRRTWVPLLREHLPAGARVQLLLAHGACTLQCQEVPHLNPRERRDLAARLAAAEGGAESLNVASALDPDPLAEGGHAFWMAAHPMGEMDAWVDTLQAAGAQPCFVTLWTRAFLAALPESCREGGLFLAVQGEWARLLYFRGRGLALARAFRLSEGMDPAALEGEDAEAFTELAAEECSRFLQFIKQKFRGVVLKDLWMAGFAALPGPLEDRFARGLRMKVTALAPSLPAHLLAGLRTERERGDGLNLLPVEIQDALKLRIFRTTVWMAAVLLLLALGGLTVFQMGQTRQARRALQAAEEARGLRLSQDAEARATALRRFPLLRVRLAETRQKQAAEQLESLGLSLFQVPEGVLLQKVEILQEVPAASAPGQSAASGPSTSPSPLLHRFTVEGLALSRRGFSVGPLASYLAALAARPGMRLDPLQEVSVADQLSLDAQPRIQEQAVTRFRITGVAP